MASSYQEAMYAHASQSAQAQAQAQAAYMNQQAAYEAVFASNRFSTYQEAMNNAQKAPSQKPSRFDGPDVIDLVPAADGSYHVPLALEHRVRQF